MQKKALSHTQEQDRQKDGTEKTQTTQWHKLCRHSAIRATQQKSDQTSKLLLNLSEWKFPVNCKYNKALDLVY